jgi:hypothetical protein
MSNRKVVAGLLAGLAAGAVIAVLASSGKKRGYGRKLAKKGSNLAEDLKEKFNAFIDGVEGRFRGILK